MTAQFEFRIAPSWITKSALEASSAFLLENFPIQSDQVSIYAYPWGPPEDKETLYPVFTRYTENAAQQQQGDGPVKFQWSLPEVTAYMLSYIENYLFGNSIDIQSNLCTVKTLMPDNTYSVIQCFSNRPIPNVDYKKNLNGGSENYKIRFTGGTIIASGIYT